MKGKPFSTNVMAKEGPFRLNVKKIDQLLKYSYKDLPVATIVFSPSEID